MPFPRCKGYAYEDSNHIPLAIRYPRGMLKKGRTIEDFVSFIDIAPTILDYAGIDAKNSGMLPITGESWRPILESDKSGRVVAKRDHTLIGKERTDVGRPNDWGYPIRGSSRRPIFSLKITSLVGGQPETLKLVIRIQMRVQPSHILSNGPPRSIQ